MQYHVSVGSLSGGKRSYVPENRVTVYSQLRLPEMLLCRSVARYIAGQSPTPLLLHCYDKTVYRGAVTNVCTVPLVERVTCRNNDNRELFTMTRTVLSRYRLKQGHG